MAVFDLPEPGKYCLELKTPHSVWLRHDDIRNVRWTLHHDILDYLLVFRNTIPVPTDTPLASFQRDAAVLYSAVSCPTKTRPNFCVGGFVSRCISSFIRAAAFLRLPTQSVRETPYSEESIGLGGLHVSIGIIEPYFDAARKQVSFGLNITDCTFNESRVVATRDCPPLAIAS